MYKMSYKKERLEKGKLLYFNQERKCGNFTQASGSGNRIQRKDMSITINEAWSTHVDSQDIWRKLKKGLDMELKL